MQVMVVRWTDGDGVSVIVPARKRREGESWRAYYADVFDKTMTPEMRRQPHAHIPMTKLPPTRERRADWRLRGKRVVVIDQEEETS